MAGDHPASPGYLLQVDDSIAGIISQLPGLSVGEDITFLVWLRQPFPSWS